MKISILFKENSPKVLDFSCTYFIALDGNYCFYGVKTDYAISHFHKNVKALSLTRKRMGLEVSIENVNTMRVE